MKTIDWEQRRYEIAKEVFPFLINREKFNEYLAAKLAIDCANVFIDKLKYGNNMEKKKVNIIEKGLEEREETLMVKGIYDKLEDYRKEHPESSFMVISYYNNKDKVGTSFLLGKEDDIAKECSDLMFYKMDTQVAKAFNSVFKKLLEVINRKW